MPRVWAEAYRDGDGLLRARLFRASWWRPWRATHVMEVLHHGGPDPRIASWWTEEATGVRLEGTLLYTAHEAGLALRRREASDSVTGAWTAIVPLPRMRLVPPCSMPGHCGDPRLPGFRHHPDCALAYFGTSAPRRRGCGCGVLAVWPGLHRPDCPL